MFEKGHEQFNTGRTWFKKGHHLGKGAKRPRPKHLVEKVCLECKTIFYAHPYRKDNAKFCSKKCADRSRIGTIAWNRGIPATSIQRKRQSLARLGVKPWNKGIKFEAVRGNKHWNWKGGRYTANDGYVYVKQSEHPFCDHRGYILEHRLVVEKHIGRYLLKKEEVHHLNGKSNNHPSNLMAFANDSAHKIFEHHPERVDVKNIIFDGRKISHKNIQK